MLRRTMLKLLGCAPVLCVGNLQSDVDRIEGVIADNNNRGSGKIVISYSGNNFKLLRERLNLIPHPKHHSSRYDYWINFDTNIHAWNQACDPTPRQFFGTEVIVCGGHSGSEQKKIYYLG